MDMDVPVDVPVVDIPVDSEDETAAVPIVQSYLEYNISVWVHANMCSALIPNASTPYTVSLLECNLKTALIFSRVVFWS